MKKIVLTSLALCFGVVLMAQNAFDALKYSEVYYQGTARSMAMGSAFGAVGADFSSLSINPAGMGLYRSSEYMLSPTLYNKRTESTYNGMYADDSRTNFALSNFGYVGTTQISNSSIRYAQFAIGMNRTNDFNNRWLIQGMNPSHSKVDVFLDMLNGVHPDDIPFDIYPLWETYVIDQTEDGEYTSPVPQGGILQEELLTTWGSTNEWLLSGSINVEDRFFFGATVGLPFVRSFYESIYSEYDENNEYQDFDQWNMVEQIDTRGWGINLKLGAIVQPFDFLRIGASFHTPTYFYDLEEVYQTSAESDVYGYHYFKRESAIGEYVYNITTPMRAIGSLAFIIGNFGIISADYEYVDYSTMRLRSDDYSFSSQNRDIRDLFSSTSNIRVGTEWRFANVSVRGGYAFYGSPLGIDESMLRTSQISFGLGYTGYNYNIDFAYIYGLKKQDYYLYNNGNYATNLTNQDIISNSFVITTRFRF